SDPADDEAVRNDPEDMPGLIPQTVVGGHAVGQLDAQADDGEALARRDAERDEVVPHLWADGDEGGRRPGQQALEQAKPCGARGVEVAPEDMAVEGVDDDRGTRAAREEGGEATDGTGLRGMRVEDLRPLAADQTR